ncbi:hypothetical protein FGRMN_8583 [Fusarium graminum]|nr:hypothetical protein FGRMN_8583 [Fusarium graminum]
MIAPNYETRGQHPEVEKWMKPVSCNKKSMVNGMKRRLAKGEQEEEDLYEIFFKNGKGPEGAYGTTVTSYIKDHISKDVRIPWHQIDAKKGKKWEKQSFEKIKASDWWREPNEEEQKRMDKMKEGCILRKFLQELDSWEP